LLIRHDLSKINAHYASNERDISLNPAYRLAAPAYSIVLTSHPHARRSGFDKSQPEHPYSGILAKIAIQLISALSGSSS